MKTKCSKIFLLIFAILLLRLLSLGLYSLYDTTEARYAGIGMRMVVSGDYLTPMVRPSVPFLAKPPFSFWVTALGVKVFGFNEFGARIPHFVISISLLFIIFCIVKKFYDTYFATVLTLIFSSTIGFVLTSGMVMTEASLIFSTTLSLVTFWIILEKNGSKHWNYLFFASFGLSMLVKGPVGVILVALPMFIYLTFYRKWINFFKKFLVIRGTLIFFAISAPWYIVAQLRNSTFFEYFFIDEHIKRFLMPGWSGDLYGHAHQEPLGMIWLFIFGSMLPWILYPVTFFSKALFCKDYTKFKISQENAYFLISAIVPLLFFTFARNIIPSYAMFVFAPLSFLTAKLAVNNNVKQSFLVKMSVSTTIILILVVSSAMYYRNSDKLLVQTAIKNGADKIYYVGDSSFSSEFYSHDSIVKINLGDIAFLPKYSFVIFGGEYDSSLHPKQVVCNSKPNCLYRTL